MPFKFSKTLKTPPKTPNAKQITTPEELCALDESEFVSYMVETSTEEELRQLLTLLTQKSLLSLPNLSMPFNKSTESDENTKNILATQIYNKVKNPSFFSQKNLIKIITSRTTSIVFGLLGLEATSRGITQRKIKTTTIGGALMIIYSLLDEYSKHLREENREEKNIRTVKNFLTRKNRKNRQNKHT